MYKLMIPDFESITPDPCSQCHSNSICNYGYMIKHQGRLIPKKLDDPYFLDVGRYVEINVPVYVIECTECGAKVETTEIDTRLLISAWNNPELFYMNLNIKFKNMRIDPFDMSHALQEKGDKNPLDQLKEDIHDLEQSGFMVKP